MRIAWVSTWDRRCGIADYSKVLLPQVQETGIASGLEVKLFSLDEFKKAGRLLRALKEYHPQIIHFQHEYGIYGGKTPPLYWFPRFKRALKRLLPKTKLVASAHTVIDEDFRYPLNRARWQTPFRLVANSTILPLLGGVWRRATWSDIDLVLVHSRYQSQVILDSGAKAVEVIPHYVIGQSSGEKKEVDQALVFGFFTPDKGQDLAIQAWALLKKAGVSTKLLLAGGARSSSDLHYLKLCQKLIKNLSLENQVFITGFVDSSKVSEIFSQSKLVICPFRDTSGSGSLAQALGHGSAILTSDLKLNKDMNERVSGCVDLFQAYDVEDLAEHAKDLLQDSQKRESLKQQSRSYAESYKPQKIAQRVIDAYQLLSST
jgi:glycosyltransferase involved in cell wall biosynthesis